MDITNLKKYILAFVAIWTIAACNTKKQLSQQNDKNTQVQKAVVEKEASTDTVKDIEKETIKTAEKATGKIETQAVKAKVVDSDFENLEHALLWEISGNELEEKSYLYGTIHLIDEDKFFWPDSTMATLNMTEKVVFEIDLDDMFNMGAMMGMLGKVFMKDGMTLKKLLNDEDYKIVSTHMEDVGIPMFMMEKIKPMFLSMFAEGNMGSGGMEGNGMTSYEMVLYEIAQEKEMEVLGLETVDDQISIFDSIPYETQAEMLLESIEAAGGDSDQMDELVNMYLSQDINAMVSTVTEEDSNYKDFEDLFLNNRNNNWIPLMADYMENAPTFFAVGAGHLGGPEGVINLLRLEGYDLVPLSEVDEEK